MEVKVLYDSRNWTILEYDNNIVGYSYQNVICKYSNGKLFVYNKDKWTQTNKKHYELFKDFVKDIR